MSLKAHYSAFFKGLGSRLHFCAHSHHPWPDCTRAAALQCWEDAVAHTDEKWDRVFAEIVPAAQKAVAEALRWPSSDLIVFAPNTHEFVARLLSCLPANKAPRILTTDSEFHSFARQAARLEEDGAKVQRIPVEPFKTFPARFAEAARKGKHDLVFVSQVFFNSGHRLNEKELLVIAAAAPKKALVVVDGYHAFMAAPLDLSYLAERVFFLGGGYKYAQAGEGVCFLAVPPNCQLRPANTGWFADFAGLQKPIAKPVGYAAGAARFWGSTFDPAGLYRLNAVTKWRKSLGITVEKSDARVRELQRGFLGRLGLKQRGPFRLDALVSNDLSRLGHFLTFKIDGAPGLSKRMASQFGVLTDARGDRLRFGFGLYQDESDLDELFRRIG